VSRRTIAQPFAQGPEENQGQADLFGLPLSSTGIEQSWPRANSCATKGHLKG
jgi:hypothetical protein